MAAPDLDVTGAVARELTSAEEAGFAWPELDERAARYAEGGLVVQEVARAKQ